MHEYNIFMFLNIKIYKFTCFYLFILSYDMNINFLIKIKISVYIIIFLCYAYKIQKNNFMYNKNNKCKQNQ